MSYSMILALDSNNLIGDSKSKNGLPWHHPEDLKYYREKTINKINIMGKTTYNQIGFGLPKRETYVLSRKKDIELKNAKYLEDLNKFDKINDEIMIVGGVEIFKMYFNKVDKIYLTKVKGTYSGDCYYDIDLNEFELLNVKELDELNFEEWIRIKK